MPRISAKERREISKKNAESFRRDLISNKKRRNALLGIKTPSGSKLGVKLDPKAGKKRVNRKVQKASGNAQRFLRGLFK